MKQLAKYMILGFGLVLSFVAQGPSRANTRATAMRAQSASSVSLNARGNEQTLEINNVAYDVTGDSVAGRPRGQRLLLRKTMSSKEVLGDKGIEATTTLEAWPLGMDLNQKPLYTVKVSGTGGQTVDNALYVAARGLEEFDWWSVYRLGTGQHLFDTDVPLLSFSISRDVMESRYVGLQVPPDDVKDARLKRPNVVAVITYASEARVKKELLLTCDDPRQAADLRSYSDVSRTVSVDDSRPPHTLKIAFRPNVFATPAPVNITIPLAGDSIDLAHAQLPPYLHLAAWKR
jgi:hypothetical protein